MTNSPYSNIMLATRMVLKQFGHSFAVGERSGPNRVLLGVSMQAQICHTPDIQPLIDGAGLTVASMNM
jgi:hypothetical protein